MNRPLGQAALVLVGVMLLQAAWILTIPPFRGIDEFDHVYRVAAANEGQWRLTEEAQDGRGLVAVVPRDIVDAAARQCAALEYTGPDNCFPIAAAGPGLVRIATAAGAYNPVYYAAVGLVARPFSGAESAYAMRIFSAFFCAIGVAIAAWALATAGAGTWTRVAFLIGLTPVLLYSSMLPAPNGLEMVSGLCLWAALLALGVGTTQGPSSRKLILLAAIAAGILAVLRTLGPLWLVLLVGTSALFIGWRQVVLLVKSHRFHWVLASVAVLAGVGLAAYWTLSAGLTEESSDIDDGLDDEGLSLGTQPLVWLFQIVAAFPLRNEPAAPAVYVIYFLILAAFFGTAVAVARGRRRWVLLAAVALVSLVPVALTVATYETQGMIWQGRYQLAYAAGVPLMAGQILDQWAATRLEVRRLATLVVGLLALTHAWSVIRVLQLELDRLVSAGDTSWIQPSSWLLAILTVGGFFLLGRWVVMSSAQPADSVLDVPIASGDRARSVLRDQQEHKK